MAYSTYKTTGHRFNQTPQNQPIPNSNQVPNNAGGFGWNLDLFKSLERFLILGTEGGSYYVGETKLTQDAARNASKAIEADGRRAVDIIVGISDSGRAPKNDPAIFALALAASTKEADTRSYALSKLSQVCRIPTHLFHFLTYVQEHRGWGRGLKKAVAAWYNDKDVDKLAYSVIKYQSRDGFSNRDALRLAHPKTNDPTRNELYKYIVKGWTGPGNLPQIVRGFEAAKAQSIRGLVDMIHSHNLSREMLPTDALKEPEIWEALLEKMPLTAMIRNLGVMSKVGLLKPLSIASKKVIEALHDREALKNQRVHPMQLLIALKTYSQGHGTLGSSSWNVVQSVCDALDNAFYLAFDYVEPSNKGLLLAIDVSGSMGSARVWTGKSAMPNFSAAEAAAAMALAIVKTEPNYEIIAFDTDVRRSVKIAKNMSLREVVAHVNFRGGGTDCASPINWATQNRISADAIVILTDNETWAGKYGHPSQAMNTYRSSINANAKIINLGFSATRITINDPSDWRAMDVAGLDANVPALVSEFVKE